MKRSIQVSAPLLTAVAMGLATGCRQPQMQRCIDEQNRVVPDSFCQNSQNAPGSYGIVIPMYRYYYGGFGSYQVGSSVSGGGYIATPGTSYSTSTTRGGFGSSGSGSSSGSDASSGSGS